MNARYRILCTAVVFFSGVSCKRLAHLGDSKRETALKAKYDSPNGMISVHYPEDFAAKTVGTSVVQLVRNVPPYDAEVLTFLSVEQPISNDVGELERVIAKAEESVRAKNDTTYVERSHEKSSCFGVDCVVAKGTWTNSGNRFERTSSTFLRNGHGYSFTTIVPESLEGEDAAVIRAITEATEFREPKGK